MTSPRFTAGAEPLTQQQIARCLAALRETLDSAEVVYRRRDRIVLRHVDAQSGRSIIVKMWSRPDLNGRIRQLMGIAACDHEFRSLMRLRRVNMIVPCPLGTARLVPDISGYTDVLFMEDLGKCESSTEYFKRLIRDGDETLVTEFEDTIIEMTAQILQAGMLDIDHGLVNTVVQASGRPVRLDFELARHVFWPRLFPWIYGQMLGHVILLHAFAVQPDVDRTFRFAQRLLNRLQPSRRVLKRASSYVQKWLENQTSRTGIETRLSLPWDDRERQPHVH